MAIDLKNFEDGKSHDGDYDQDLLILQDRLARIQTAYIVHKQSAIIAYEGWDASGKGGTISRMTGQWDPRYFEVWPIAAPTEEERERHVGLPVQTFAPEACEGVADAVDPPHSARRGARGERSDGEASRQDARHPAGELLLARLQRRPRIGILPGLKVARRVKDAASAVVVSVDPADHVRCGRFGRGSRALHRLDHARKVRRDGRMDREAP